MDSQSLATRLGVVDRAVLLRIYEAVEASEVLFPDEIDAVLKGLEDWI